MSDSEIIGPFQERVAVHVTYHDSNEYPEESCVDKVVSFKAGDRIYQYFGMSAEEAIELFKREIYAHAKHHFFKLPNVVFCVITRFNKRFLID